jgi:hypothetical protein
MKTMNNDSVESVKAFMEVYKVLMSPRCMNCHPSGDVPLQGDDNHLHTMLPRRGKDGKGVYAMKCQNCHQPQNTAGIHTPPGNPKWQLPPADMKMVFQGKSSHDLALQIMDYSKNGHKNKEQLLEHARDTLVKAGWNMGEGRPAPPLAYNDFLKPGIQGLRPRAYASRTEVAKFLDFFLLCNPTVSISIYKSIGVSFKLSGCLYLVSLSQPHQSGNNW